MFLLKEEVTDMITVLSINYYVKCRRESVASRTALQLRPHAYCALAKETAISATTREKIP
jgi:hypothetical protein